MKARAFHVFIALVLLTAVLAATPRYYVHTGLSKAMAPAEFKDQWRSGFNLGAGLGFTLTPRFEVMGALSFHQMQLDDNAFLRSITTANDVYSSVSGGTASIFGLAVDFKYSAPSDQHQQITPYLLGAVGIGAKSISAKKITTFEKDSSEEKEAFLRPAVGLSIGFEIIMAKTTSLVVELGAQVLFTQEPSVYFPLKFGIVIN